MPTYDYRCEACGYAFEEFQSMTAKTLRKCPKCGKNKLVRLIGIGAGVIFKGSGFYETDYRSDSYKQAAKAEKENSSPASGDAKSESKKEGGESKAGESGPGESRPGDSKPGAKTDAPAVTPASGSKSDTPAPSKPSSSNGGSAKPEQSAEKKPSKRK